MIPPAYSDGRKNFAAIDISLRIARRVEEGKKKARQKINARIVSIEKYAAKKKKKKKKENARGLPPRGSINMPGARKLDATRRIRRASSASSA